MRRSRSNRSRHLLYPEIGGRIRDQRSWLERWLPFGAWIHYALFAWTTRRLVALGVVGVLPAAGIFAMGVDTASTLLGFALTAGLLAAIGVGGLFRPNVAVVCDVPARVEAGRDFAIRYAVTNTGARAVYDLAVDALPCVAHFDVRLSPAHIAVLPSGQRCTVEGHGKALHRGRYRLPPLRCDTDFPSGLWRWGRTDWTGRQLAVHPAYTRLTSIELPEGARNRVDLQEARQLTRAALEFHGCREFRAGDAMRHVHARSSARLGIPVVKEFQAEGRGRTAIVVDTWRRSPTPEMGLRPDPVVEASLSLAAAIVDFLARSDRVLELLVAGPGLYRFVSAGRIGFFEDVLDILASVETGTEDTLPKLAPVLLDEIRSIQSVCLLFGRWDERRAALARDLADREVGVKTVLITRSGRWAPKGLPSDAMHLSGRSILRGEVTTL